MARIARKRRRVRAASPLDIRKWVIGLDEEEVYDELCRRVEALEFVAKPLAAVFIRGGIALGRTTLDMLRRQDEGPTLSPEEEGMLARASAASLVAAYWRHREYRPATMLPPIMIAGLPWDTLPDHIHVLDLSPKDIRKAALPQAVVAQLSGAPSAVDQVQSLQLHLEVALGIIRQFGPWALFNPVVITGLFHCLVIAQYTQARSDAHAAASYADALLDALRPDLSRRVSRTPDNLANPPEDAGELLVNVRRLMALQRQRASPKVILSKAKEWFGPRVDGRDLRRWKSKTAAEIVTELLGGERPRSEKTLRDYRRLDARAAGIAEGWKDFQEYLQQRPTPEQLRITGALPPFRSPRLPQSPQAE